MAARTTHLDAPRRTTGELRIAATLDLPLTAVTETFAILGRRGSGKTNTATVMVEEMIDAGAQVAVIDPTDAWWGLRLGKDGKSAGKPVVIFGGAHADLPLSPESGKQMADLVVEEKVRAVFSLRHFSKTEARRWVGDFGERLYDRKGETEHRTPLHLVIDEADAFVPQRIQPGGERAFGAIDTIVRRGRSSGLGTSLVTQRPQVLNKDVLTQTEVLVCHQTSGPQDRKALLAWVEQNASAEGDVREARGPEAFLATLASLPRGTAWFWSPGLLKIFSKVQVRARTTFDSSATPTGPSASVIAASLPSVVNLDHIRSKLADTIERAKSDDPRALRARIADLERRPATAGASTEVTTLRARVAELEAKLQKVGKSSAETGQMIHALSDELRNMSLRLRPYFNGGSPGPTVPEPPDGSVVGPPPADLFRAPIEKKAYSDRSQRASDDAPAAVANALLAAGALRRGEFEMLRVLASYKVSLTKAQLGTLSGFTPSGGTFRTYLNVLRREKLVETTGIHVDITDAGVARVPPADRHELNAADVVARWKKALRAGEVAMLDTLIATGKSGMTKWELGQSTHFEVSGGTFRTYLNVLRRNGLVVVNGDDVRVSDALYLGAGRAPGGNSDAGTSREAER